MHALTKLAALGCLLSALGCGGGIPVDRQATYYLQYNLHARGNDASSINYWSHQTLLPVCTPVNLVQAKGRRIVFTVNGQRYLYTLHRTTRVNLATHLERTFQTTCPDLNMLPPVDQQGVGAAQPRVGMSKKGVLIAVGYPPDHRTPRLEDAVWTYWGVTGSVQVNFNGDLVSGVTGNPQEPAVMAANGMVPPAAPAATAGGATPTTGTTTASGIQIQEHDDSQTVPVSEEATVVVTDPNGYPARVPQSAIGRACGPQQPCHEALVCQNGQCQAAQ
jgi:hypothetical protein